MNATVLGLVRARSFEAGGLHQPDQFKRRKVIFSDQSRFGALLPADLRALHVVHLESDVEILSELLMDAGKPLKEVGALLESKELLPDFGGSRRVINRFHDIYNGSGLRFILRKLSGASLSVQAAEDLLAAALEDALIATLRHVMPEGRKIIRLDRDGEHLLITAIAERLPRVYEEEADVLAAALVDDLKDALRSDRALAIDDGAVTLSGDDFLLVDVGASPVRFSGNLAMQTGGQEVNVRALAG
jgi:hypothetical protein